ncbi:MAG: hypothetical protein DYH03_16865, partial [Nitrospira sp. NTP1]|nr:hypothetical protein [Nitrospira sp. NTP1]
AARQRITQRLREMRHHCDGLTATTGIQALKGYYPGLSDGIVHRRLDDYRRRQDVAEAMPMAMASLSLHLKDRRLPTPVKAESGDRST